MSNNEKPITAIDLRNLIKDLPIELQGKINYLLDNPTAKVVKLSDPQRGSTSNQLFGLITSIDLAKPILTDVLNFKIDVKDHQKFFTLYADYGKNYKEVIELLKKLENLGIDLLKCLDKEQDIRNKRLRSRVFDKKADTQKLKVKTKKTSTAKTQKQAPKTVNVSNEKNVIPAEKNEKAVVVATTVTIEEKVDAKEEIKTTKEEKK